MPTPYLSIGPDHPDFLDLDWSRPIDDWTSERLVELPTGVHRHPVRFVAYEQGLYAIKELPVRLARHEHEVLTWMETRGLPSARPVGHVERRWRDPHNEDSGAVISKYVSFSFTYHELLSGGGFGPRRNQLLDALAGLLVEMHLSGCFWGDCSLSNVLYWYDAEAIGAVMIDAETVEIHESLTDGQRAHDIEIMRVNVAGGMADIAASHGISIDDADLTMGDDIAERYGALWNELAADIVIGVDQHYLIHDRVSRLRDLGFEVDAVELVPTDDATGRLRLRVAVGGRRYHSSRLAELTRIEASEHQARQILSDLHYYQATGEAASADVAAIQWRVDVFEPLLARIGADLGPGTDRVQKYCDFLNHRYLLATEQGRDVSNDEAYASWAERDYVGYPVA